MADDNSFKNAMVEVKLAYNIVDYIQASGITLKSSGSTKYKGLCFSHSERSASFSVDEHFQNYRCFGCGVSGDIISFVMAKENLEFYDAVKKLAEDKGIELNLGDAESTFDYKSIKACIKEAANFYLQEFRKLPEDHPARKQISERELTTKKMRYGYAPEGRQTLYKHLKELGFSDEIIGHTGVCMKYEENGKMFDFWNGRLMFFITDITGKPIGFSGRKLYETDPRGKYVNSTDGPLFDKGASLFNVDKAKKLAGSEKEVLVVEGQFDVAAYVEADSVNVVASSGTAFTEKQAMICRRLVTEDGKIIFCFDGDKAGSAAAEKVFKAVPMIHSQAFVVSFPDDQDPCDYRLEHGNEALKEYTKTAAKPLIEFVLETLMKKYDLDSPIERSRYLEAAARVLKTVANVSLKETYTKKVALDAFTSVDTVREVVSKAKPLETGGHSKENDEEQSKESIDEKRPELDATPEVDIKELVKMIKGDEIYNITARLITMTLRETEMTPALAKTVKYMPKELRSFAKELAIMDQAGKVIPERFENVKLAEKLINANFFPLSHLMSMEENKDQFRYLRTRLINETVTRKEAVIRHQIARILEQSTGADSEFLSKALAKEESELLQLKKLLEQAL